MKLINQLKHHDRQIAIDVDLELALIQSICTFKSSVLGDPRILLMGSTAMDESIGESKNDLSLNEYENA